MTTRAPTRSSARRTNPALLAPRITLGSERQYEWFLLAFQMRIAIICPRRRGFPGHPGARPCSLTAASGCEITVRAVIAQLEEVMNQSPKSARPVHLVAEPPLAPASPRRIRSGDLLQGQKRLVIEHGDASYTLLLTRNGKLILTK